MQKADKDLDNAECNSQHFFAAIFIKLPARKYLFHNIFCSVAENSCNRKKNVLYYESKLKLGSIV